MAHRRWALAHGLSKEAGYAQGIAPGLELLDLCKSVGVQEVSIYCFTQDNTRRAAVQTERFTAATIEFAQQASARGASLFVLGDESSAMFPRELAPFRRRTA